jgi:DNA-binding NarL/FixJ family response regulator
VTTVFIVSDVRLYRDGLATALAREEQTDVVGTAESAAQALEPVAELRPDAVLVDVSAPGGVDGVRVLVAAFPDARVVALAISDVEREVVACAEAGVAGYVTREAGVAELVAALDAVGEGDVHCTPKMAGALLRRVRALTAQAGPRLAEPHLTRRERQIVDLIDGGLSNKEIAGRLQIEVATVKNHVHNILEKLGVSTRGAAAARARI